MGRHKDSVVDHTGAEYSSIDEMCSKFGITVKCYRTRMQRGWSQEEALTFSTKSIRHMSSDESDRTDFLGNTFMSVSDMARFHGTTYKLYYMRLKSGRSMPEALQPDCTFDSDGQFSKEYISSTGKYRMSGREGMHVLQTSGHVATIVDYVSATDLNVKLDDGTTVEHTTWKQFYDLRSLSHSTVVATRNYGAVGQARMQKNGHNATLVEKLGQGRTCKCIIELDDGTVLTVPYESWSKGKINYTSQPDKKLDLADVVGKCIKQHCGLDCKVVGGSGVKKLDVEFEDGVKVSGVMYATLARQEVQHPLLKKVKGSVFHGYELISCAYRDADKLPYYICKKDNKEYLLTPKEMITGSM